MYPNPLRAYTQKKNKTKKEQGEIGEKARESLSWDFEINHFFAWDSKQYHHFVCVCVCVCGLIGELLAHAGLPRKWPIMVFSLDLRLYST